MTPRLPSPETLAAIAKIPRWTRRQAADRLGLEYRYCARLCRRHLDGAALLSDLDIAVLKGRDRKTGPKGPRGHQPRPLNRLERAAARREAWARIIDPTGALDQVRQNLDLQAARLEAERKEGRAV